MASIPWDDIIDVKPIAIDAQQVATQIKINVLGSFAGNLRPSTLTATLGDPSGIAQATDYVPRPIVHTYTGAEHSTYNATFFAPIPANVINPWRQPDSIDYGEMNTTVIDLASSANAYDADPATYAQLDFGGGSDQWLQHSINGLNSDYSNICYGFYMRYMADWEDVPASVYPETGTPVRIKLTHTKLVPLITNPNWARVEAFFSPPHSAEPTSVAAVLPVSQWFDTVNRRDPIAVNSPNFSAVMNVFAKRDGFLAADNFRIYEFFPLILNETLLDGIAKAAYTVPAADPVQVRVRGYVPVDSSHTLEDWLGTPGNDVVKVPARQQILSTETVIDFEQEGPTLGEGDQEFEGRLALQQKINEIARRQTYEFRLAERG